MFQLQCGAPTLWSISVFHITNSGFPNITCQIQSSSCPFVSCIYSLYIYAMKQLSKRDYNFICKIIFENVVLLIQTNSKSSLGIKYVTTSCIKLSLQWFIIMNHENSQPVQCLWVSPLHTNIHSHTQIIKKTKLKSPERGGGK